MIDIVIQIILKDIVLVAGIGQDYGAQACLPVLLWEELDYSFQGRNDRFFLGSKISFHFTSGTMSFIFDTVFFEQRPIYYPSHDDYVKLHWHPRHTEPCRPVLAVCPFPLLPLSKESPLFMRSIWSGRKHPYNSHMRNVFSFMKKLLTNH